MGILGRKVRVDISAYRISFSLFLRSRIARVQVTWRIEFIPYDPANPVGSLPIPLQFAKSKN